MGCQWKRKACGIGRTHKCIVVTASEPPKFTGTMKSGCLQHQDQPVQNSTTSVSPGSKRYHHRSSL